MVDLRQRVRQRVVPAVPVPCDAEGAIDQAAHRRYVAWMAGQSVGAVALWAHTGRGLHLSDEQRALVLRTWRDGAPGR